MLLLLLLQAVLAQAALGNAPGGLWTKKFIGEVSDFYFDLRHPDSTSYVTTKSGVVASLDLNQDDIKWRQILPKSQNIDKSFQTYKHMITMSNKIIRKWRLSDGALVWESSQYTRDDSHPNTVGDATLITPDNDPLSDNSYIVNVDSTDKLTLYHPDGTVMWIQPLQFNDNSPLTTITTHTHNIVSDIEKERIYVVTMFDSAVAVTTFTFGAGKQMDQFWYKHECESTLPSHFEVICPSDQCVGLYQCSADDASALYAFSFDKASPLTITPLSLSFDHPNPKLNPWRVVTSDESDGSTSHRIYADQSRAIYSFQFDSTSKSVALHRLVATDKPSTKICDGGSKLSELVTIDSDKLSVGDKEYLISFWNVDNHGGIQRCWAGDNVITIVGEDLSLHVVSLTGIDDDEPTLVWTREESLALPVSVNMFDETEEDAQCRSEDECEALYHTAFPSTPERAIRDLQSIAFKLTSPEYLAVLPQWLFANGRSLMVGIVKKFPVFQAIANGLQLNLDDTTTKLSSVAYTKIVVMLTEGNKLFGMQSESGTILWSLYLPSLFDDDSDNNGDWQLVELLKISNHPPHLLVVLSNSQTQAGRLIFVASPFHSHRPAIHVQSLDASIRTAFVTGWTAMDTHDKIVLLIEESTQKVHIFPETNEAKNIIFSNANSIYYHALDTSKQALIGYRLAVNAAKELVCDILWTKSFANTGEEMVDISLQQREQLIVNSVYRTGERGALFKYLNPHLLVVATLANDDRSTNRNSDSDDDDAYDDGAYAHGHTQRQSIYNSRVLHIYVIDGVTGRVHRHDFHRHVTQPVSVLVFENKVIYAFWNDKTQFTEISVMDLWLTDPIDLPNEPRTASEGYIVPRNPLGASNRFSSFSAPTPIITTQAYNFQFAIDHLLTVSNTRYAVTNRVLLAKLADGSVFMIDTHFLNSRRPIIDEPKAEHKDEKLMPYRRFLPFKALFIVSADEILTGLRAMISGGSSIESTTLLFGYGLDLFYRRVTPSQSFDAVADDFDFLSLFLILTAVVVAICVATYYAKHKQITTEWE